VTETTDVQTLQKRFRGGPPWHHLEPLQLLYFNFYTYPDLAFHSDADTDRIRIWLPKMMRIHAEPCPDPQYYQTPENDDTVQGGLKAKGPVE